MTPATGISDILKSLTLDQTAGLWIDGQSVLCRGALRILRSPIDGAVLGEVHEAEAEDVDRAVAAAVEAFRQWRMVPAPQRGELMRRFGLVLREYRDPLARLVSLECGKILAEALGEVQEMIDICDYAVGLSRQLSGLTLATERPQHRMMEQWHPLGPVGVISAFNFPVAVWAWNAAIAIVAGDSLIWKPSEKTPLCAMACQRLLMRAAAGLRDVPPGLSTIVVGGRDLGRLLAEDRRVPLVSATGSVSMGREVARTVAGRLGRSLLELGGNNACIVAAHCQP
jgi:aldehyde dehydrogenase (NAD+)